MRIAIIENELFIAEMLKELLKDLGHDVVWIANNYEKAKLQIGSRDFDLCFVDINLGEGPTGFDVAKIINQKQANSIIFLTSYSDKATITEAMQFNPQAYLTKPFSESDLFATLALVQARQKNTDEKSFLLIKDGTQQLKLLYQDILFFRSNNIYVEIVTPSKLHLIRTSLQKLLEKCDINTIVRIHRTFAVNLQYVKSISSDTVIVGDEKLPLSRMHKDQLIEKFKS